jgi:hypothetical protein
MILEKQKEANVMVDGEEAQQSIAMSLDLDSAQILMQMLSKNLYSDAIGSTIRETASNALDSHRRAGVTDPIIVSFGINNEFNYEFSVEDFGIGLDADDVANIISKYGKSTKRNSDTELGMMGLGFKAPLAYSSTFYFICRKNGMERKYMMYEGEDTNTIDLFYEKPTSEKNGVKVIIPVKRGDTFTFSRKIREQLAYFESVYFNCKEYIDNDFEIIRHEHFQFSPLASNNDLHMCLDNVYYPLDFEKLGISRINLPLALRFSLSDGIFPTPNREAVRYTEEAKKTIIEKIGKVADYFINKYNEKIQDTDDVKTVFAYFSDSSKYLNIVNRNLNITSLANFASVKFASPKLKNVNILNIESIYKVKDYLFEEYECNYHYLNGRFYSSSTSYDRSLYYHDIIRSRMAIHSEKIGGVKKDYLREFFKGDVKIIKKEKLFKLGNIKQRGGGNYDNYMSILKLYNHPKSEWRTRIKEFQYIISQFTKDFIDIDKIEVPQEWLDNRKKKRIAVMQTNGTKERKKKLEGEVSCKVAKPLERYVSGRNLKYELLTINMATVHQTPFITVYGTQKDDELINKLYPVFSTKSVRFVVFSEREIKRLENIDLHNWMTMEEFMKGENKVFKRVATSILIDRLMSEQTYIFHRMTLMKLISEDLYQKIEILHKYPRAKNANKEIEDAIIGIAEKHGYFDTNVYSTYKEVKFLLEKLPFMNILFGNFGYNNNDTNPLFKIIIDLCKYHRHRIDWKHYKLKLNEQNPLTEEQIDEALEESI